MGKTAVAGSNYRALKIPLSTLKKYFDRKRFEVFFLQKQIKSGTGKTIQESA